jgi:type IV secretion system protein TrbL
MKVREKAVHHKGESPRRSPSLNSAGRLVKLCGRLSLLACAMIPSLVWADTAPSAILNQYSQLRTSWIGAVSGAAQNLFAALALIEFAWSAAVLLLEKSDFQSWTAGVVRKLMWIGAFYTLLLFGPTWIPAIVDSFIVLGQNAAGTGALAPGDVYTRGLQIAGSLLKGSSDAGFFTNFGSAFALVLAALLAFLAFLVITVQFVVALVESYIVVSAGFIFLGFGGSRWTAPYVERYIGLAVSVGVKIMILYLLIGSGMTLSNGWLSAAVSVPTAASPSMSALDIMGAALIFMAVCWQAPKLIAGVIGGSPALSGGDVISTAATLAGAAYFASSVLVAGGRAAADRLAGWGGSGSGGSSSPGSGGGGRGNSPAGGPSSGSGGGGGRPSQPFQPPTPGGGEKNVGGGAIQVSPPGQSGHGNQGSGGTRPSDSPAPGPATSYAKAGAVIGAVMPPSDAAPHAPPPRLNFAMEGGEE